MRLSRFHCLLFAAAAKAILADAGELIAVAELSNLADKSIGQQRLLQDANTTTDSNTTTSDNNITSSDNNTTSSGNNNTSSENNTTSSGNNNTSSDNNITSSGNNITSSDNNSTSSDNNTTSSDNNTTASDNNTTSSGSNTTNTTSPGSNTTNTTSGNQTNVQPNSCMGVKPGDISPWVINSKDKDEIAFYVLVGIQEKVGSLFLTDNAWNGTYLQDIEGTYEYKIPVGGIKQGATFGLYKSSTDWVSVSNSTFALGSEGDNLFLYCLNSTGGPHFIFGFSYFGPWVDQVPNTTFGVDQSMLPGELSPIGNVAVEGHGNWRYNGPSGALPEVMKKYISNSSNWQGSDLPYDIKPPASASNILANIATTSLGVSISCWILFASL